jgi:hypothetical protein
MATYTVNFDDGTSHTYDNVPDDVTQDQVNARAANEFSDKNITGVSAGEAPAPVAPEAPYKEPSLGEKVVGGVQTAAQTVAAHPTIAGAATELGLAALPQTNIPVLKQAQQLAKSPIKIAQGAVDAAQATAMSRNAQALSQMEHQARQYLKMNQAVPQGLQDAIDALRSKVAGGPVEAPAVKPVTPPGAQAFNNITNTLSSKPPVQPVAPGAAQKTAQIAATQGPAAVEGSSFIQSLSQKFAPMAEKVAPVIGRVAANPVVQGAGRVLSSPITLGAQLMAHSSDLGPAVPGAGPYRGMEINPNTHRPWTKEELAAYNAYNK